LITGFEGSNYFVTFSTGNYQNTGGTIYLRDNAGNILTQYWADFVLNGFLELPTGT